MKNARIRLIAMMFASLALLGAGCDSRQVTDEPASAPKKVTKRVGMVVGLKPEMIDEYKRLHADGNAGVRDLLTKYNLSNFSIFLHQIEGKWYEFGYYEYVGDDFEGDMAKLDAEPGNKEWLKVCDPMQLPLEGETSWAVMEQVYRNN